jgi:hypothetical protein
MRIFIFLFSFVFVYSKDIIWLDGSNGDDYNEGTELSPKKTLLKALVENDLINHVVVNLKSGVYLLSGLIIPGQYWLKLKGYGEVILKKDLLSDPVLIVKDGVVELENVLLLYDSSIPIIINLSGNLESVISCLKFVCETAVHTNGNAVILLENGYGVIKNSDFSRFTIKTNDVDLIGDIGTSVGVGIISCTFSENRIHADLGSLIYVWNSQPDKVFDVMIQNCTFSSNEGVGHNGVVLNVHSCGDLALDLKFIRFNNNIVYNDSSNGLFI